MKRILASSSHSQAAYTLVEHLQTFFVTQLNTLSDTLGSQTPFEAIEWFREEGKHGGGVRYVAKDTQLFNRASVNVSQVQYESDASKSLYSASAISTIIHPKSPYVPSMHMHISWTELKDGSGYWRIMADLNPAIVNKDDTKYFSDAIAKVCGDYYEEAALQGDKYFYIPVLKRHRGVSHFYLENFTTGDFESDLTLAQNVGETVINTYIKIITKAIEKNEMVNSDAQEAQLAYHTLYLLQVLTLDRGTTSGLLVHNQNDVGILGSIPEKINRNLLATWIPLMPTPQDELLQGILSVFPQNDICIVNDSVKQDLANVVRTHYKKHPQALAMQAQGNSIPTTVINHK